MPPDTRLFGTPDVGEPRLAINGAAEVGPRRLPVTPGARLFGTTRVGEPRPAVNGAAEVGPTRLLIPRLPGDCGLATGRLAPTKPCERIVGAANDGRPMEVPKLRVPADIVGRPAEWNPPPPPPPPQPPPPPACRCANAGVASRASRTANSQRRGVTGFMSWSRTCGRRNQHDTRSSPSTVHWQET